MVVLIAEEIRRLRMSKSFSQDYMAEKLGITQQAYSKIENQVSEASLSRLQQIAQILDVPLPHLLGLTEEEMSNGSVTPSERKVYHEIIVNQQKIIEKQEETIRTISASLVILQTGGSFRPNH
ncbi:MAG: helix-turn-helix transcriptional regulator [Bacteroidetes bacterium]|nr:MAG: helix-turn-helix transcriptional regulator [Bacteroidota bacterium]